VDIKHALLGLIPLGMIMALVTVIYLTENHWINYMLTSFFVVYTVADMWGTGK